MRPHLVIGASGQVGGALLGALRTTGLDPVGTHYRYAQDDLLQLDITDAARLKLVFEQVNPEVVYLATGANDVNRCEVEPDVTADVNVTGVHRVALQANRVGARIVFFSSDYVFDGLAGPYSEEDCPRALSEYGRQKLRAEHIVATHSREWLTLRTTVVYGWEHQGKNFICRLLRTLSEGQELRVPMDQISNPTYAPDLAEASLRLICSGATGLYHVVGSDRVSRYEFALAAVDVFGLDPDLVIPVTTEELGQRAHRPLQAGMLTGKVAARLGATLAGFWDGLQRMEATKDAPIGSRKLMNAL